MIKLSNARGATTRKFSERLVLSQRWNICPPKRNTPYINCFLFSVCYSRVYIQFYWSPNVGLWWCKHRVSFIKRNPGLRIHDRFAKSYQGELTNRLWLFFIGRPDTQDIFKIRSFSVMDSIALINVNQSDSWEWAFMYCNFRSCTFHRWVNSWAYPFPLELKILYLH